MGRQPDSPYHHQNGYHNMAKHKSLMEKKGQNSDQYESQSPGNVHEGVIFFNQGYSKNNYHVEKDSYSRVKNEINHWCAALKKFPSEKESMNRHCIYDA